MDKVYIVRHLYHEHVPNECYASDSIGKVFDSEEKAIQYIYDRIKVDHEYVDITTSDKKYYSKYDLNMDNIKMGEVVESYEYENDGFYKLVSYMYNPYDVE